MPRKKKESEYTLISPIPENVELPEDFKKMAESLAEQDKEERRDIDFIKEENDEQIENEEKPKMKIKEIKYGFSVLTNIGNFENIRSQVEVSAEIEDNSQMMECIDVLSKQIKDWGRREYKQIKSKAMQTMPNNN